MFQPPDGKSYIGAWYDGHRDYNTVKSRILGWKAKTGKGIFLLGYWEPFNYPVIPDLDVAERLCKEGVLGGVVLAWGPYSTKGENDVLGSVANGSYDDYMTKVAQRVKNFPYPIYIRFGHEMNGDWSGFGYSTEVYIKAWRRARDIFNSVGAKAEWIFSPAPFPKYPDRRPWQDYYPGDAYVEWIAPSFHDYTLYAYSQTTPVEQTFEELITPHLDFAIQHNKTFGFTETSFRDSDKTYVPISYDISFTNTFFDFLSKNDRAKMVIIFDMDTTISTSELLQVYKEEIANSRYVGK